MFPVRSLAGIIATLAGYHACQVFTVPARIRTASDASCSKDYRYRASLRIFFARAIRARMAEGRLELYRRPVDVTGWHVIY